MKGFTLSLPQSTRQGIVQLFRCAGMGASQGSFRKERRFSHTKKSRSQRQIEHNCNRTGRDHVEPSSKLGEWAAKEAQRCDDGDPDLELCELEEVAYSPPSPPRTSLQEAFTRGRWLVGLLVLQSTSSFILESYEDLLREHLVVTVFLTMLVGAGGNAGNQSAIKVIRGLVSHMLH
jgi:hypothetical protein